MGKVLLMDGYAVKVLVGEYYVFEHSGEPLEFYESEIIPKEPLWRGSGGVDHAVRSVRIARELL